MGMDFDGLNELAVDLRTAPARTKPLAKAIVAKTAFDMEADMKVLAPVDTGNLVGSVGSTFDSDGLGAEVGPTADYSWFVENGTSTMPAQPFVGPAFDRRSGPFLQALGQMPIL